MGCSGVTKAAFVHPSRPTDIESVKQDCECIVNLLADLVLIIALVVNVLMHQLHV